MSSVEEEVKNTTPPKFCKDCYHRSSSFMYLEWENFRCLSPQNIYLTADKREKVINFVTGEFVRAVITCADARLNERFCGKEAKWFEVAPTIEELIALSEVNARVLRGTSVVTGKKRQIDLSDLM